MDDDIKEGSSTPMLRSSLKLDDKRSINKKKTNLPPAKRNVRFSVELDYQELEKMLKPKLFTEDQFSLWYLLMIIFCIWPDIINSIDYGLYIVTPSLHIRCNISALENTGWSNDMIVNVSKPQDIENNECFIYDQNYTIFQEMDYYEATKFVEKNKHSFPTKKCEHFIYHYRSTPFYSVVEQHQLVCNMPMFLNSSWQMMYAIYGFTYLPVGLAADMFGRIYVVRVCINILIGGLLINTLGTALWSFYLGKILTIFGGSACSFLLHLYAVESTSIKWRPFVGQIIFWGIGIGNLSVAVLVKVIPHCQYIEGSLIFLSMVLVFGVWIMNESPTWLLARGQYNELSNALEIMGISIEDDGIYVPSLPLIRPPIKEHFRIFIGELRMRIILNFYVFLTCNIAFAHNVYLSSSIQLSAHNHFIVYGSIVMVQSLFTAVVIYLVGRKLTISCVLLFLCFCYGIVSVRSSYNNTEYATLILGLSFSVVVVQAAVVYSFELYPVTHCGTISGSIQSLASYIVLGITLVEEYGGNFNAHVKTASYLLLSFSAAIIILFLPGTSHQNIPLNERESVNLRTRYRKQQHRRTQYVISNPDLTSDNNNN